MNTRNARKAAPDLEAQLLEIEVGPSTMAAFIGVTPRQLSNLVRDGVLPKPGSRGKYALAACNRAYVRFKNGPADDPANKKLAEQRARLTATRAATAELQERRLRGELTSLEEVTTGWRAIASVFRSHALALPRRAAPQLALMSKPAEIETYLREKVFEMLEALSQTKFVGVGADADHADLA